MLTVSGSNGTVPLGHWSGGSGEFYATGTFSSGTLSLQRQETGDTNWITIGSGSTLAQLTANGTIGFTAGECELRASLSGATSANISLNVTKAFAPGF